MYELTESVPRSEIRSLQAGLLNPRCRKIKRVCDVVLVLALGLVALPFAAAIALAIVLETPGPVFFGHMRVGRDRRRFRLWKFRSMVVDADAVFRKHLEEHPEHRAEWLNTHKLKNDPRVTRVGRLLRRSSLDELPQLWNVLRGEMSMIGPRPIVEDEIPKYGPAFSLYTQVSPGLTGLWQVSGRNDTTYRQRTALDEEYILHWSLWKDLVVLLRTVRVVILGHGAY